MFIKSFIMFLSKNHVFQNITVYLFMITNMLIIIDYNHKLLWLPFMIYYQNKEMFIISDINEYLKCYWALRNIETCIIRPLEFKFFILKNLEHCLNRNLKMKKKAHKKNCLFQLIIIFFKAKKLSLRIWIFSNFVLQNYFVPNQICSVFSFFFVYFCNVLN